MACHINKKNLTDDYHVHSIASQCQIYTNVSHAHVHWGNSFWISQSKINPM